MGCRPTGVPRISSRAKAFFIYRKTAESSPHRPCLRISSSPSIHTRRDDRSTTRSKRPLPISLDSRSASHQPAGNLSGGEQQMLALARAIISTPKILLLDEPSLGLSPRMVREAYRVLRGFKARGMAILLVEQNVHAALRFANRGYVLRQGVIVQQGEADVLARDTELFNQYLGFT